MAWTETCKIDFQKQIEHKKEQGISVRKALKILSEESGIPIGTLSKWTWPEPGKRYEESGKRKKNAIENDSTQLTFSPGVKEKIRDLTEEEFEGIKQDAERQMIQQANEIRRIKKAAHKAKKQSRKESIPENLSCELICDDFANYTPSEPVDIIITDPPYPKQYMQLYEDLAEYASNNLKEDGSLLVMAGQSYLPEILSLMTPHIHYHWTVAYLTPGGQSVQLFQKNVNTFWKPVLWFVKGKYQGDWIGDVCKSNVNENDKRYHGWGQSESGMRDIIERFTYPGQTILDPFCGGGTTGAVAVKMNRKFIGIDIDENAIETTRERIAELGS